MAEQIEQGPAALLRAVLDDLSMSERQRLARETDRAWRRRGRRRARQVLSGDPDHTPHRGSS